MERVDHFAGGLECFDARVVAGGDHVDFAGARLSFVRTVHPPETLGVRIEHDGSVIAYSADTGPDADFDALAADVDLFLCEATLQDSDEAWEGHMMASQAGEVAARVGVRRLLLTHLPPERDYGLSLSEAHMRCGGVQVQLASDGLRLEA
jgi:ribonuclease BN (tRNA processing enzyme)